MHFATDGNQIHTDNSNVFESLAILCGSITFISRIRRGVAGLVWSIAAFALMSAMSLCISGGGVSLFEFANLLQRAECHSHHESSQDTGQKHGRDHFQSGGFEFCARTNSQMVNGWSELL